MKTSFWMTDEHLATAQAAGALPEVGELPICALHVGDTISFPAFRALAFRVVSRHFRTNAAQGEPSWLLQLEPAPHPM